jgi:hypothetical protein
LQRLLCVTGSVRLTRNGLLRQTANRIANIPPTTIPENLPLPVQTAFQPFPVVTPIWRVSNCRLEITVLGTQKNGTQMRRVIPRWKCIYVNAEGRVADFHALRQTVITNLSRAGVSPKMAQSLARHSDINLTMNVYTVVSVSDQAAAVESLPPLPGMPGRSPEERPRLRVTG